MLFDSSVILAKKLYMNELNNQVVRSSMGEFYAFVSTYFLAIWF